MKRGTFAVFFFFTKLVGVQGHWLCFALLSRPSVGRHLDCHHVVRSSFQLKLHPFAYLPLLAWNSITLCSWPVMARRKTKTWKLAGNALYRTLFKCVLTILQQAIMFRVHLIYCHNLASFPVTPTLGYTTLLLKVCQPSVSILTAFWYSSPI